MPVQIIIFSNISQNGDKNTDSSGDEGEVTVSQSRMPESMRSGRRGHNVDEMAVMAAKQMGRELFSHLTLEERKEKLDAMVCKIQNSIFDCGIRVLD